MIDQTFSVRDGIGQADETFEDIVHWGRKARPAPDRSGSIGKPAAMSGQQVVRWMRAYSVTIRDALTHDLGTAVQIGHGITPGGTASAGDILFEDLRLMRIGDDGIFIECRKQRRENL